MKITAKSSDYKLEGRSGHGKTWAKVVSSVDHAKTNGYAFEGEFLPKDGEVELVEGDVILSVAYFGSRKNGEYEAQIILVENGKLEVKHEDKWKNIITIREKVAELINDSEGPLSSVHTDDLIAELETRGYTVNK